MEIRKAAGLVLHSRQSGEADIVARVLTAEFGKTNFIFKGLKKSKKRSLAAGEPGTLLDLMYSSTTTGISGRKRIQGGPTPAGPSYGPGTHTAPLLSARACRQDHRARRSPAAELRARLRGDRRPGRNRQPMAISRPFFCSTSCASTACFRISDAAAGAAEPISFHSRSTRRISYRSASAVRAVAATPGRCSAPRRATS